MFKLGDFVSVHYTGTEYTAFISKDHIETMIKENPHKIIRVLTTGSSPRYYLQGRSTRRWPSSLLKIDNYDNKNPDWEV